MSKLSDLKIKTLSLQLSIRDDERGGKTYGYYLPCGFIACDSLADLKRSISAEIQYLEDQYNEVEEIVEAD